MDALVLIFLVLYFLSMPCLAAGEGDKLPYTKGMEIFYDSMTGPVPFVISLVGIIGCGAMLIFGGEISGFLRTMVFIILVVAVIVQAGSVVTMLGGKWGAQAPGTVQVGPHHGRSHIDVEPYAPVTVA
jgi:type IV secretion system protein VirB2